MAGVAASPLPRKRDSNGLPTASNAAGSGVGPLSLGRGPRYADAILAIAQTQQAISRAVAQLATTGRLPAAAIAPSGR